jgi:ubiquinone/menaquinone biosynthesis C-methylase UbiE
MLRERISTWKDDPSGFQDENKKRSFASTFELEVEIPYTISRLGNINNKCVIDLGCGDGEIVEMLKSNGAKPTGIDCSCSQIDRALAHFPTNNYVLGNLENKLPFYKNSFDHGISRFVLMYIDNISQLANETSRVIKPKGVLSITIIHPFYPYLQQLLGFEHSFSGLEHYEETVKGYKKFGKKKYDYYYRSTGTYIDLFRSSGFVLDSLREIVPDDNFINQNPELERMRDKPTFLTLAFINNK